MFIAETNAELQVLCDKVSAFCELYQVKISAGKSYYTVDRGVRRNKQTREVWRPGQIRLWDHMANGGVGACMADSDRDLAQRSDPVPGRDGSGGWIVRGTDGEGK